MSSKIKIYTTLLIFGYLIICDYSVSIAQDSTLSVTGYVIDETTGNPINDHLVLVNISGTGFFQNYEFYTNEAGFYGSESLLAPEQGIVIASTIDCIGEEHVQEGYINPVNNSFVFDFIICNDSIPPPDCENWFWYESWNMVDFTFMGEAFPPADTYFWDFGDGNTGNGQMVDHSYNINDLVNVTLTTFHFDPATGDSCMATSSQEFWVGNGSGDCTADFYYNQDSLNQLTVNFFDSSSGVIINRFWDFGDSTFSEETNPVHIFPEPGIYPVCLSIFSDSLGYFCTDMFCLNVEVDYSIEANFIVSLDTLSGLTNNYYFTGTSIGEATSWHWNFGDENTSSSQNPTHQYAVSGTYEVCLEVSRNFPGFGVVSDNYCQTINTPNYFDFGGQVFIDGFPLNNYSGDTTIVDTGMAFLYRKYDYSIIPVDTNIFYDYGYYWFSEVREGDYLVKVGLTANSLNYKNVAPSYYQSELHWDKANTLYLSDSNYFVNIDLIELSGIEQGPGSISGFISNSGKDFINTLLISEIEILLFDSNNNPLTYTLNDESGNFAFENIPLGTYKLYAEATGFLSFELSVLLNEENPSINNINLELYEQTVGTEEYFNNENQIGNIYPNPVKEKISLDIELDFDTELLISIFNINGQKISEQKINFSKGSQILNLNSEALPNGIYLLTITSSDRKIIETRKFVK